MNNVVLNPGVGGSTITTADLSSWTGYPTTGELPLSGLYVSGIATNAPTPVCNANPLPVAVQGTVATTATIGGTVAVTQSGAWTVALGAGASLVGTVKLGDGTDTVVVNADGSLNVVAAVSGTVAVSNLPATQPVSGTVTVQDGGGSLTVDGSVAATQGGTWPVRAQDGSGNALTSRAAGTSRTLEVAILDASGNQVTTFGGSGGTASTYGSAFPATGTAAGASNGTTMQPLLVDGSGFLKVNVSAGSSGNAAASATGAAVPASADYAGLNVGGTLRGQTGVGLVGSVYAAQVDLASFGGAALVPGQASMSASIPVAIAANQSTLAVSGTVTANAGTGTFTVGGTVTANAGTGTMAVSVASLPLPAGAATAAKQPAPGTAGTASADVLTVQGIASMTALKVDGSAVTQPVSIGAALPAGTNLLGAMAVGLRTDAIFNGTTALTPKWAVVNASSSGSNTIVAAVTSKKIRVLKWSLWAAGAVDATWRTSTGPADVHGKVPYSGTGSGPMGSGAFDPTGHFETLSGDALILNLSGAVAVTGIAQYVEV